MSEIHKSNIFCFAMTESKNYIDKNKKNPLIGLAIDGDMIVFDEKELTDDKWLFCHKDGDIVKSAKEQVEELNRCKDWIGILE